MAEPFVILAHSGHGPLHYDLMLQRGQTLATWQLGQSPLELSPGQTLAALKLTDHRLGYLTYEGPVSGGRGEVAHEEEGTYELLSEGPKGWRVRLNGARMRGVYLLRAEAGGGWVLACESAG
ncbi:MAG: hypothetical protein MUP47_08410 [Phycisphaerae bacterium]|nr:hypothetical protein [Phycisphaerae bacterium]